MKFTISQIQKAAYDGPFKFDDKVDVSEIEKMNNDIRKIEPVHVFGECTLRGEQFIFNFTIEGKLILPDARTLEDVIYPFHIKALEIFSTSAHLDDEEEIHPVDGEVIDLTPYIKENILLDVPFRIFSDKEKDNALTGGDGWSFLSEEKKKEKTIDPRLQKLELLLNKKKKDE